MRKAIVQGEFISAMQAGKILGCAPNTAVKALVAARVATKTLPGLYPKYSAKDVERIAREAIRPAGGDGGRAA